MGTMALEERHDRSPHYQQRGVGDNGISTTSALTVAQPDAPESVIEAITQRTTTALHCRHKNKVSSAIKEMEQALAICETSEYSHPAIAVEAARARLNFAATLSRADRHLEAFVAIKDAQRGLASVLEWAPHCSPEDKSVEAIVKEARMLHCAAKMAEAIELEPMTSSTMGEASMNTLAEDRKQPQQLYEEATRSAEELLPRSHPLNSFAERFHVVERPQRAVYASGHSLRNNSKTAVVSPHVAVENIARAGINPPAQAFKKSKRVPAASAGAGSTMRRGKVGASKQDDMFQQFLRDSEQAKESKLVGGREQDDLKRLHQTARSTRLELLEFEARELRQPHDNVYSLKYTPSGHSQMMDRLGKVNVSRSEPSLMKNAKQNGQSPETVQLQQITNLLPKPPTPREPVKTKSEAFAEKFGSLGQSLGSALVAKRETIAGQHVSDKSRNSSRLNSPS